MDKTVQEIIVKASKTKTLKLDLSRKNLTFLPDDIYTLNKLQALSLADNQIDALSSEIIKLNNLNWLSLSNNRLISIPPEIGKMNNLVRLDLSGNNLNSLPSSIGNLNKLEWLDLSKNNLSDLPIEIEKLGNLKWISLAGNNLPIPPEIIWKSKEPRTIINYFIKHNVGEKKPLNEAKVLIVGQGSVGKTSIIKRLIDDIFDPNENKTEGINIKKWSVKTKNSSNIILNIWDFGGQEIMHATHQFFLTKRSLYLLVIDSRLSEENNRLEYWIKIIQSFAGNSPIIIVGNKIDQHPLDLDSKGLADKYQNIRGIIETSCKTGFGIQELINEISKQIDKLKHVHDNLLISWLKVKNELEKFDKDYISYNEYIAMCQSENIVDTTSQETLIGFLHDLGIILNFRDDPRLIDTNILNPEWVTNGVYKILNSNELFHSKGILQRKLLNQLLDTDRYPKDKHLFIIDMMRKFELCFDFEGFVDNKFLVPDLLSKEEPYTGEWVNSLLFQYHYNILPNSIISRFIVRMNNYIFKNTYWRYGVVLKYQGNKALIKSDKEEKRITIWINGPEKSRRILLGIIRSDFYRIHSTIPKIEVKEKVPLPDFPNTVVDYQHLINLENLGVEKFIPEGLKTEMNVVELLNGIENEEDRKKIMDSNDKEESKLIDNRIQNNTNKDRPETWERIITCIFGFFFIATMLVIAILFPSPTNFQIFIFRVILSLAASGVGAFIPGFINVEMKKKNLFLLRAGGAIALFLIVYQINPPVIMSE